ncbi:hypothetical protein D3C79_913810 [compost metagenome]
MPTASVQAWSTQHVVECVKVLWRQDVLRFIDYQHVPGRKVTLNGSLEEHKREDLGEQMALIYCFSKSFLKAGTLDDLSIQCVDMPDIDLVSERVSFKG